MLKRIKRLLSRNRAAERNEEVDRGSPKSNGTEASLGHTVDRAYHADSEHGAGLQCVPGVMITETVKFELPTEHTTISPEHPHILHSIREESFDLSENQKRRPDSGKDFTYSEDDDPNSPIEGSGSVQRASLSRVTSSEEFRTPAAEFTEVEFIVPLDRSERPGDEHTHVQERERPRNPEPPPLTTTTTLSRMSVDVPKRQASNNFSPPTPSSSNASSFVVGHEETAHDGNDEATYGSPPTTKLTKPATTISIPFVASVPFVINSTWLIPVEIYAMPSPNSFEYQFGGLLGEGGFGKVVLALSLISHAQFAMKLIQLKRIRGYREALSVANEIKVLQTIYHAGVSEMPFLARPAPIRDWIWQFQGNLHIVMDYCQGGDLGHGVERHPELRDPARFKLLVAELVIALLALHDRDIVHHDVKPTNVLIDAAGHCALTDFGGAYFPSRRTRLSFLRPARSNVNIIFKAKDGSDDSDLDDGPEDQTPIFTLRYAAPEVLGNSFSRYGQSPTSDYWSLGVTLFELATGHDLVDEIDDNEAVSRIQRGDINYDQLSLLSAYPGLRQIVSSLLILDPSRRLSGHNIKSHSYFADYTETDWEDIATRKRPPFLPNKYSPVDPTNTSYDVALRAGEEFMEDADPEIVCRWLEADGIRVPHHRASASYRRQKQNARLGLPGQTIRNQKMREDWWRIKQPSKKAEEQPKSMWWTSN